MQGNILEDATTVALREVSNAVRDAKTPGTGLAMVSVKGATQAANLFAAKCKLKKMTADCQGFNERGGKKGVENEVFLCL